MQLRALTLVGLLALGACEMGTARSGNVDTQRIVAADAEPGTWLTHGRTYEEQRFSPLTTIDRSNVDGLGLAWAYELRTDRGAEATPLVVDGVMYVTSAWSVVHALDARTGEELWVHDPAVDRSVGANACCDVVNRGVAIYDGKIFSGVIDGRLVALDAADGSLVWSVVTVDQTKPYTITGAPRAANGLVYIGNGGAEYGVRGYVSAYDTETGDLVWRFYTVPGNPADGPDGAASDGIMSRVLETWNGEWWRYGGGGTVWDAIVYDAELDQLVVGVGNGSPWNQQIRSPGGGDNWFLSSILALDARTGAYRWHYQTTPGETWDYTATQPIVLADLEIEGEVRPVAMQLPKNGFFYVVDRETGELISGTPAIPMFPADETPPGLPLSWAYAIDEETGRPIENAAARYREAGVFVRPGALGAHNWHPMSFNPLTGLVYVPVQELALGYENDPTFERLARHWNIGIARTAFPEDAATRAAVVAGSTGQLVAWDPVARRAAWRVDRAGPWNGGTLSTAGGLVFQGTIDGLFQALDAESGEVLWEHDNSAPTLSGPMTYEIDGEQYVTVLGGFGTALYLVAPALAPLPAAPINGRVFTFRLGGTAPAPAIEVPERPTPAPPAIEADAATLARGADLYGGLCAMCHGAGAIAGAIPDLRKSAALQTAAAW
ncbi:MAG TPA: PQQ-dependent dehydrogenase, methanol/ethanol family, partial [Longimicrobiales bacterium]|nr:PQQ-dependent dehydrogenase, methanol/ethanol family [Longimicrobiales bacterium]